MDVDEANEIQEKKEKKFNLTRRKCSLKYNLI